MTTRAFTLIELLIVVAIIAILAAIAVPNFLEAQTRAKVSRAVADMRTIATGAMSYLVDNNQTPPINPSVFNSLRYADYVYARQVDTAEVRAASPLTTPVSYLTTVNINDPFNVTTGNMQHQLPQRHFSEVGYGAVSVDGMVKRWDTMAGLDEEALEGFGDWGGLRSLEFRKFGQGGRAAFILFSPGPDKVFNFIANSPTNYWIGLPANRFRSEQLSRGELATPYDPTNGTVSGGDIIRYD